MVHGVELNIWSFHAWSWLHTVHIPRNIIYLLPTILPCGKCSNHMSEYISRVPILSEETTESWIVGLHNDINIRNNKKIISLHDARLIHTYSPIVSRRSLIMFILIILFVHSRSDDRQKLINCLYFIKQSLPTVNICTDRIDMITSYTSDSILIDIYSYLKPFGYDNFDKLFCEFVPPSGYKLFRKTTVPSEKICQTYNTGYIEKSDLLYGGKKRLITFNIIHEYVHDTISYYYNNSTQNEEHIMMIIEKILVHLQMSYRLTHKRLTTWKIQQIRLFLHNNMSITTKWDSEETELITYLTQSIYKICYQEQYKQKLIIVQCVIIGVLFIGICTTFHFVYKLQTKQKK
jgi:hypothetical protein